MVCSETKEQPSTRKITPKNYVCNYAVGCYLVKTSNTPLAENYKLLLRKSENTGTQGTMSSKQRESRIL